MDKRVKVRKRIGWLVPNDLDATTFRALSAHVRKAKKQPFGELKLFNEGRKTLFVDMYVYLYVKSKSIEDTQNTILSILLWKDKHSWISSR